MLLGVIADDFTGAGDIANTLAKGLPGEGGLDTVQLLGVPEDAARIEAEAAVIALKSRSIAPSEAVDQSLQALRWLLSQGCRQVVFKYCSTFDSTPRGNIGPVGEALAEALGAFGVVACPAFPATGRTVYQGHLFVHDRLLSESGLESHPLNPMTDPDIRRWLGRQATGPVALVALEVVRQGPEAIAAALAEAAARGERLAIVDALTEDDLVAIGQAVADAPLVTGGSGIALALPHNFIARGLAKPRAEPAALGVDGPEAILAGSCSGATRAQVAVHAERHPTLEIDVERVLEGSLGADDIAAFLRANEGRAPLAFSSASPDKVRELQDRFGREQVAQRLDRLFAETAAKLVAGGVRRLVVAGGETSGAVVSALDLGPLAIGREIDPGVPVLVSRGAPPVALALKSGNFGAPDFFSKALARLAGR